MHKNKRRTNMTVNSFAQNKFKRETSLAIMKPSASTSDLKLNLMAVEEAEKSPLSLSKSPSKTSEQDKELLSSEYSNFFTSLQHIKESYSHHSASGGADSSRNLEEDGRDLRISSQINGSNNHQNALNFRKIDREDNKTPEHKLVL
jgi:hypothetical protein